MAMLLRTRKVALGLKVFCIVSVTATYAILAVVSRGAARTSQDGFDSGKESKSALDVSTDGYI
jgi:hypothetical protein